MRKHDLHRLFFIILLGIGVPWLSRVINPSEQPLNYVTGTLVFFIILFAVTWLVCRRVHAELRALVDQRSPFARMLVLCGSSAAISSGIVGTATWVWIQLNAAMTAAASVSVAAVASAGAALCFTLLFESVYLSEERESEQLRARRLQEQWRIAELDVLKHQLEPHFMANALNNLLFLIQEDAERAKLYTRKLAQVEEYFLRNRERDLVPLETELAFLKDYYFLLSIRHRDKLRLEVDLSPEMRAQRRIVPCALQIPLENAIKHNVLSSETPLVVRITMEGDRLVVSNPLRPKPFLLASTHIGLHNLSERYRLACRLAIDVCRTAEHFVVRLPLVA